MARGKLTGWLLAAAAIILPLMGVGYAKWRSAIKENSYQDADPFHIAGNLYFVGSSDVSIFLVTSPEGHVLIDAGSEGSPPKIAASMKQLGFDIKDVKVILSSEAHSDHAAALAALKSLTGARIVASDSTAEGIESGGDVPGVTFLPINAMVGVGLLRYEAARVDRRVKDGEAVSVGPLTFTAHITSGHTIGCTTWTFTVRDTTKNRNLNVVDACDLSLQNGARFTAKNENYPGIRADYEHSFATLRALPVDVWMTSHGRPWGRYRKYVASRDANNSVEPFIDRDGYRAYVDSGEARVRREIAKQSSRR